MANALGNLFREIAEAIRAKTGGSDKMSPKDFPAQISGIQAGGGGDIEWVFAKGSFTSSQTGKDVTVNHNLGVVPDVFWVQHGAMIVSTTEKNYSDAIMMQGLALNSSIGSLNVGSSGNPIGQYYVWADPQDDNIFSSDGATCLDSASGTVANNATETNITVKGTYLLSGKTFYWFAIGHK
jgi:hypothetical protein